MNQDELIEKARAAIEGSERELARRIGISSSAMHTMKKGKPMPDRIAVRLADLAGLDRAETLAGIQEEKADPETKEVWKEIAKRTRSGAGILVALVLATLLGSVGTAGKCYAEQGVRPNLYIMSSRLKHHRKRLSLMLQWFAGLFGHPENLRFPTHGN